MRDHPAEFGFATGEPPKGVGPKSGFMPALKAGVENLKGDIAAVAGRSGIMDLAAAEKYRAEKQKSAAETFKPTEDNWIESPLTKLGELAGGSLPYMAAPLAAGVAVGALPLTGTAAAIAGAGAAGLTSAAQFTGSNLSRQLEEDKTKKLGETDLGAAALAAVPQAALDMLSFKMTPGLRGLIYKTTGKQLAEKEVAELAKQGLKATAADYVKATGKTMTAEGLTEAAQQVFERMQAGLSLTDPEAQKEYFENFLGGAVLGGAIAPAGRFMERGKIKSEQDAKAREAEQVKLDADVKAQEEKDAQRKADPGYLPGLLQTSDKYTQQIEALKAAAKAGDKEDPVAQAAADRAAAELKDLQQSDEYQQHTTEMREAAPQLQALRAQQAQAAADKAKAEADAKEARLTDPAVQGPLRQQVEALDTQKADLYKQIDAATRSGDHATATKLTDQYADLSKQLADLRQQLGPAPTTPQVKSIAEMQAELESLVGGTTRNGFPKPGKIAQLLTADDTEGSKALQARADALRAKIAEPTRARDAVQRQIDEYNARNQPAATPATPAAPAVPSAGLNLQSGATSAEAGSEWLRDRYEAHKDSQRTPLNPNFTEQRELPLVGNPVQQTSGATVARREKTLEDLKNEFGALVQSARTQRVKGRVPDMLREQIAAKADEIRDFQNNVARQDVPRGQETEGMAEALAGTRRPDALPPRQNVENVGRTYTPAEATPEAVTQALQGLPQNLSPADEALAGEIARAMPALKGAALPAETVNAPSIEGVPYDKVTADLAPRRALEDVAEYLHKVRTGNDSTAEAAKVRAHLDRLESGKRDDTVVQEDMFQDTELQGTLFNSYAEFENYLASDAVQEARKAVGKTLPTVARLRRMVEPMQAEAERLRNRLEGLQAYYAGMTAANDTAIAKAEEKLKAARDALDAQLQPLQAQLIEAQLALSNALQAQAKIADTIAKNTAKFNRDPGVQDAAAKVAAAQRAHADMVERARTTGKADVKQANKLYQEVVSAINEHRALIEQYAKDSRKLQERSILAFLNRDMELMLRLRDADQTVEQSRAAVETAQQALTDASGALNKRAVSTAQGVLTRTRNRAASMQKQGSDALVKVSDELQALEWKMNEMLPADRAEAAKGRNPDLQAARERISALKEEIAQHNSAVANRADEEHQGPTPAQVEKARSLAAQMAQEEANLRTLLGAEPRGPEAAGRAKAATAETQAQRENRDNEQRRKEQESAERLAAVPGVQVTHENVQKTLNEAEKLPERIRALDAAAKDETKSKYARTKAAREAGLLRERAKMLYGLISNDPAMSAAAREEIDRRIAETEQKIADKQIAVNEAGKSASTIRSRRKELTNLRTELRELNRLRKMSEQRASFAPVGTNKLDTRALADRLEAVEGKLRTEEDVTRKADLEQQAATLRAELDRRDEAEQRLTLERGINLETEGTTGKLPARTIGPVVKKAVQAGNMLTGDTSTTGERMAGSRNKAQQSGKKKGVSGTQAMKQAAKDTAHEQALLKLSHLEDMQERNDAALERARAAKDTAKIAKHEEYAKRLAEGIAIAQKRADETASIAPEVDTSEVDDSVQPVFRTATAEGPGMKIANITSITNKIMAEWTNTPPVKVVQSISDLPKYIREQAASDERASVPGVFDPREGVVYLVADHLHSPEDVALAVAHEVTGHYGLRDLLGNSYGKLMNDIYNSVPEIKAEADAKMQETPSLTREIAVEEILAEKAETQPGKTGLSAALSRIFYAIKAFVRNTLGKMGFKPDMTRISDAEVRQIVANARRHVKRGTPGGPNGGVNAASAQTEKAAPYRTPKMDTQSATGQLASRITATPANPLERLGKNAVLALEMWGVDMRAPLMKALSVAGDKALTQAAYYVRKADSLMNHVYTALGSGPLQLKKDAKGLYAIEGGNGPGMQAILDAISKVKGVSVQDKMAKAQAYLVAQRADRVGWDKLNFSAEAAKEARELADKMRKELAADPAQKAALESVRNVYNQYNKGMVQFLAESGYLSKAKAAELLQHGDYVPFYRVGDNGVAELVMGEGAIIHVGDLRNNKFLAPLVGDDQKLLPLNEAMIRNTMLLTDLAMKNLASKDVSYALQKIGVGKIRTGEGPRGDHDIIRFRQEPNPNDPTDDGMRYIRVNTKGTAVEHIPNEMLVQSLEGSFSTLPAGLKAAAWFGDILRSGVTRNPMYIMRQLVRDPMSATFTGGLESGVVGGVFKSLGNFMAQTAGRSAEGADLLRKGLIHSGIFTGDVDDINKMALQLTKGDQGAFKKTLAWWDKAAMNADAATRIQLYKDALGKGMSEVEAEFAAMEMMNFNKRGMSPTVQYASRMIPFLNAQIQGLNVLFKAMTGNMPQNEKLQIREKFYRRAMTMALFTVAYAMAMDDDETYKNARARDRYNNWILPNPLGGEHIKIPIPFEVGVLFKALPEALVDMMKGEFGEQEWKALKGAFTNQIPGGSSYGLPQAIKPVIEVVTNHNFFTEREIESQADQKVASQERFGQGTTEIAKEMSKMLNAMNIELSPKQIDHLVGGYLGSLPVMVARLTNNVFSATEGPIRPAERASDNPIYGALFQRQYGGGPVDAAYAQQKALEEAQKTYKKMQDDGRKAEAEAYKEDVLNALGSPEFEKRWKTKATALHQEEQAARVRIKDPDELRAKLDDIEKRRHEAAQLYVNAVRQIAH